MVESLLQINLLFYFILFFKQNLLSKFPCYFVSDHKTIETDYGIPNPVKYITITIQRPKKIKELI